jgi:hypothetical protein
MIGDFAGLSLRRSTAAEDRFDMQAEYALVLTRGGRPDAAQA